MFRLIARIIYTALLFVEALVATRFILKLINANQENELVALVMQYSEHFVRPFRGIISDSLTVGSLSLDLNSIIDLVFYMILSFVKM